VVEGERLIPNVEEEFTIFLMVYIRRNGLSFRSIALS
jgi:hypothetical protein